MYCLGSEKRTEERTWWEFRGRHFGHDDAAAGIVRKRVARRRLRIGHPRTRTRRDIVYLEQFRRADRF